MIQRLSPGFKQKEGNHHKLTLIVKALTCLYRFRVNRAKAKVS